MKEYFVFFRRNSRLYLNMQTEFHTEVDTFETHVTIILSEYFNQSQQYVLQLLRKKKTADWKKNILYSDIINNGTL